MNDPKTQIVEKIKSATNILVTVSANPSVDQLSACLALTMMLNNYKKNATAVFSGKVPSVINFLNPKDTLERTTDSLRDFIISLDKSKADKLRYKVEDDVVKIFITPYRQSITSKDLKYSAGDFNVDVIIALGVKHQQDLDKAITAHGRIFHDAVVVSINNMPDGDFGIANWVDLEASSLSELIASLANDLGPNLLDATVATALLTGIVAETGRFSNDKTHSRTMATSATLLDAGADQKLVNTQLQDLIGTIVMPEVGSEIVPDRVHGDKPISHADFDAEFKFDDIDGINKVDEPKIVDSDKTEGEYTGEDADISELPDDRKTESDTTIKEGNGDGDSKADERDSLGLKVETLDFDADKPSQKPLDIQPPAGSTDQVHDLELPSLAPTADISTAAPTPPSIESLLGNSVESTPSPALDELKLDELAAETQPANSAETAADADSARKAVEDALLASAVTSEPDSPAPIPEPAAAKPMIKPIASGQPSYSNPDTTTEYQMPPVPEHEPAPLGMSPADQPFTMPMPPTSSMPAPSPAPIEVVTPPAGGPVPPPLPPPMPPQR